MNVFILVEYANGLNYDYKIRGVFASFKLAQAERTRLGFCSSEQGESFGWEILKEQVEGYNGYMFLTNDELKALE